MHIVHGGNKKYILVVWCGIMKSFIPHFGSLFFHYDGVLFLYNWDYHVRLQPLLQKKKRKKEFSSQKPACNLVLYYSWWCILEIDKIFTYLTWPKLIKFLSSFSGWSMCVSVLFTNDEFINTSLNYVSFTKTCIPLLGNFHISDALLVLWLHTCACSL